MNAPRPSQLVLGSKHADNSPHLPAGRRAAGHVARQIVASDDDYEKRENEKSLAWLGGPHPIAPATVERLGTDTRSGDGETGRVRLVHLQPPASLGWRLKARAATSTVGSERHRPNAGT